MKLIRKIFEVITAVILIPTVVLVAFILIADAKDMDFKGKQKESQVAEQTITVQEGFDLQDEESEQADAAEESVEAE